MTDIAALIERLEKAERGSQELNALVGAAVLGDVTVARSEFNGKWCLRRGLDKDGKPRLWEPAYKNALEAALRLAIYDEKSGLTQSIDAALLLVPEQEGCNKAAFLHGAMWQKRIGDIPDDRLAIATCIAALRARMEG